MLLVDLKNIFKISFYYSVIKLNQEGPAWIRIPIRIHVFVSVCFEKQFH